jgi:zinc/manganese transport system permease protein
MLVFFQTMMLPFLACLLLAGIHVYLGIHVLARKVIFVDLALAQIAALGAIYGILLGYTHLEHPWVIKGFSLAFTVFGAAVFAFTKQRHERVPHEALIGITYATALSVTVLASSRLAHGADEIRELLSGSILWVEAETIIFSGLLYLAIGIFHFIFRKQFLLISFQPGVAASRGINVKFWDFIFYVGFGFVVTSSVSIAGVLLVFCYLVVPAVIATLLAEKFLARLYIGWAVGALVSFFGVCLSYIEDLPSGPTIVVCFVAFLVLVAACLFVIKSANRTKRLVQVSILMTLLVALGYFSTFLQLKMDHSISFALQSRLKSERILGIKTIAKDQNLILAFTSNLQLLLKDSEAEVRLEALRVFAQKSDLKILPFFHDALNDPNEEVREMVVRHLRNMANSESVKPLLTAIAIEKDEYIKVEMAESVLELGRAEGIPILIDMIERGNTALVKRDAYEHLTAHLEIPHGANLRNWWQKNHKDLRWQAGNKKFVISSSPDE